MKALVFFFATVTALARPWWAHAAPGAAASAEVVHSLASDGPGSDPGCRYPGALEITVINIGQGDATLIATPTRLLLADAGETYWNSHKDADKVAAVIRDRYGAKCSIIDEVVISHLHVDHVGYLAGEEASSGELLNDTGGLLAEGDNLLRPRFYGGLAYLVNVLGFRVGKTTLRDYRAHNPNRPVSQGGSKTYRNWRAYLASPAGRSLLRPETARLGTGQINLGTVAGRPVVIDVVAADGATLSNPAGCDPATYFGGREYPLRGDRSGDPIPPSENDLSLAMVVSLGAFQMFIGGDTSGENFESPWGYRYHDTETCMARDPLINSRYGGHLEVLRANHHGSRHSSNGAFLAAFSPAVSIFSVGDHNTYGHVDPGVLDRVLAHSVGSRGGLVFLTESGDRVFGAADACHRAEPAWCAQVADGEYPTATESDEAGDANVVITVDASGGVFTVIGDPTAGPTTLPARGAP